MLKLISYIQCWWTTWENVESKQATSCMRSEMGRDTRRAHLPESDKVWSIGGRESHGYVWGRQEPSLIPLIDPAVIQSATTVPLGPEVNQCNHLKTSNRLMLNYTLKFLNNVIADMSSIFRGRKVKKISQNSSSNIYLNILDSSVHNKCSSSWESPLLYV